MLRETENGSSRLPGEVESVSVLATYVAGLGWDLTINARRQFQTWSEAAHGRYERLTTAEMVTTIDAALCAELKV